MKPWLWAALFFFGCVERDVDPEVVFQYETVFATVGEEVALSLETARGGDIHWTAPEADSWSNEDPHTLWATFSSPGHYRVFAEVRGEDGAIAQDSARVFVVYPPAEILPRSASSIAVGKDRVFVAMPDFDRVAVVQGETVTHISTCIQPTTVALREPWLVVSCAGSDEVMRVNVDEGTAQTLQFSWGSRPYGVVIAPDDQVFITQQGTGRVAVVELESFSLEMEVEVGTDLRGLAWVDGDVLVSRHRSGMAGGEWYRLRDGEVETHLLAWDPGPDSDGDARGLPTYLQQIAARPDGRALVLSGLKANIARGEYNEGRAFTSETMIRADLRQVSLQEATYGQEVSPLTLDNRDRVAAAAFHPAGHLLIVATAGSQSLEVVEPFGMRVLGGVLGVGHGIRGLVVDEEGFVWVDAELSRELVRYTLVDGALDPQPHRTPLDQGLTEPLPAEVLAGKRLFYDASDLRLTSQGYIACASCHLDGDPDGLTWDFTDRGEGLRNTPSLRHFEDTGPLHWTANFDEVQDFEQVIRTHQEGTGLMNDESFASCAEPLGEPKAGLSDPLDQLAAYLHAPKSPLRSPYRSPNGAQSALAKTGEALFYSVEVGCTQCHLEGPLTDSRWLSSAEPLLHDVGTQQEGSGLRLGQEWRGVDTPSLFGLFDSAPYFHDGSAASLTDVWRRNEDDRHGHTSTLDDESVQALNQFLMELEGL